MHSVPDFAGIDKQVEGEIQAGRATGVAISVARDGALLWEAGFGLADVATATPVTARTSFSLASITKPFTTAAVAALAQAGKLQLDNPATQYLPFALPASDFDAQAITLRMLGGHFAGLPTLFEMVDQGDLEPSTEEVVRRFGRMSYPAGERYEYGNVGYSILGAAAVQVTGLSFGKVLNTFIIEPMGLADTFYDTDSQRLGTAASRYDERGDVIPFYAAMTPPSGAVYASAHDLSLFAAHMMAAPLSGKPVLTGVTLEALLSSICQDEEGNFTTFGWSGAQVAGERVIFKAGGQPGVSTLLTMIPERKLSIAILTNRTSAAPFVEALTSDIASRFVPAWTPPAARPIGPPDRRRALSWYDGRWSGSISNDGTSDRLELDIAGSRSTCTIGQNAPEPLEAIGSEQGGVTCLSVGLVGKTASEARSLAFKLIERDGRLVGRCIAQLERPGVLSSLPYIVTLSRDGASVQADRP